jgi:PAS domain S-box-containing protein
MNQRDKSKQTMHIEVPQIKKTAHLSDRKTKLKPGQTLKENLSDKDYAISRKFLDSIYDAAIVTDLTGNIIDSNKRCTEILGYSPDDLAGSSIINIIYGLSSSVVEIIRKNLEVKRFTVLEASCKRKQDRIFPSETAATLLQLADTNYLCFFIRDISERKDREQKLKRAEQELALSERLKMASMVANTIAHDINNLLSPLTICPELIRDELKQGSEARESLDLIVETTQQLLNINTRLLHLGRRNKYRFRNININILIQDVLRELDNEKLMDDITTDLNFSDNLPDINGASGQLELVLQNLIQNSIESIGNTGKITVYTKTAELTEPLTPYISVKPGKYVKISIQDNGCGMSEEVAEKVYEPFFSTKKGKNEYGIGLGLSIVHAGIDDHHGYIDFETKVGEGTRFEIYLPVAESI